MRTYLEGARHVPVRLGGIEGSGEAYQHRTDAGARFDRCNFWIVFPLPQTQLVMDVGSGWARRFGRFPLFVGGLQGR
jgi:hypothetical protein